MLGFFQSFFVFISKFWLVCSIKPEMCLKIGCDTMPYYLYRSSGCHGYAMWIMQCLARSVLAEKCLSAYLCPFADFWASRMYYSSTYTVNLELGDNFKVLFDLIYIYNVYRSWVSCKGATYFADIFTKTYTLVYFLPNVITLVIKSHD